METLILIIKCEKLHAHISLLKLDCRRLLHIREKFKRTNIKSHTRWNIEEIKEISILYPIFNSILKSYLKRVISYFNYTSNFPLNYF